MMTNKVFKLKSKKNIVAGILLFSMLLLFSILNPNQVEMYARTQQKFQKPQDTEISKVELVYVSADKMKFDSKTNILVLMNAKSQLMVDGDFASMEDISEKVVASFRSRIKHHTDLAESIKKIPKVKIIVQKDLATNMEEYKKMLISVNSAINYLRDSYSNSLFNKSQNMLSNEDMLKLDRVVEPKIYVMNPKSMK